MAARPRSETKNATDPRGQFGAFLRDWLERHYSGDEKPLAAELSISERTVRKWCEGSNGPAFGDLDRVAKALGLDDWADLAIAVRKFHRKR